MPAGVKIEESFHSILEEKLNKEQRDVTYQFINFGVGGVRPETIFRDNKV